MPFNVNQA